MAEVSAISDAIRNLIGVQSEPIVLEIEKGLLGKIVRAVDDPNPLWQDAEYAAQTGYGGIIAPPAWVGAVGLGEYVTMLSQLECPLKRAILNGWLEVEYHGVVRPGDVITAVIKLADAYEREGRSGRMLFLIIEVLCTNQDGEQVATIRNGVIRI